MQLDESLSADDVSRAWLVLSGAAEAALADAFRFGGGPILASGLVLGRGSALFRIVQLGGHKVKKRSVLMFALLLDMRRRSKAVMDVLGAMIQYGVSLARSVELTAQWDGILTAGPSYVLLSVISMLLRAWVLVIFHRVVSDVHHRLSDFIHGIVVHRRDGAVRRWRNWLREDPMVHPEGWLRPDLVPPAPFLQCDPLITPGVLGFLLIQPGLMRNSERPGFPRARLFGYVRRARFHC